MTTQLSLLCTSPIHLKLGTLVQHYEYNLTKCNRVAQLSFIYEICQSNCKTMKSVQIWSKSIHQFYKIAKKGA